MKKLWILSLVILFGFTSCTTQGSNAQNALEIHDIQGCSHTSPYEGKQINNIVGIVTHKVSNGFMMQSVLSDDLDCSSEAIFVFTKEYPGVMVADEVSVNGLVDEFSDGNVEAHNLSQTEIINPQYKVIGTEETLPVPIIIDDLAGRIPSTIIENDGLTKFDPGEDGLDFYESLEFMLVEVQKGIVVGPKNSYGEISILPDSMIDSNIVSVQGALLNTKEDANPERMMVKLPTAYDGVVNVGDRFTSPIVGVMDYSYGNYKVLAFSPVEFISNPPEVASFEPTSGALTLANYNLENLSPMDGNKKYSEIAKQVVKILRSPDVLVLNEIMDNSGSVDDGVVAADQTISRLIAAIQKAGGPTYSYSNTDPNNNQDGGIEGGNIRTILLFREETGIVLEKESSWINGIKYQDGLYSIERNPSLIGEYSASFNGTRKPRIWLLDQNGVQFFVIGAHLTSQGANSPDWGSQQPPQKPEELQRIEEARLINEQISKIRSQNPSTPIFIAGDMNDLPWSAAIAALEGSSFENAVDSNTLAENYSFIFEGNAEQMDYLLVNQNLASNVLQARFMHSNSILDQSDAVSDHDPMVIEFRLDQSAP